MSVAGWAAVRASARAAAVADGVCDRPGSAARVTRSTAVASVNRCIRVLCDILVSDAHEHTAYRVLKMRRGCRIRIGRTGRVSLRSADGRKKGRTRAPRGDAGARGRMGQM